MRYFRPKSLTWWAGAFLIAMGVLQASGAPQGWGDSANGLHGVLQAVTAALTAVLGGVGGDAAPAALIGMGAGLIGLRDALLRDRQRQEYIAEDMQAELIMELRGQLPGAAGEDQFGHDELPEGESPFPPGVQDPWAQGGSRF